MNELAILAVIVFAAGFLGGLSGLFLGLRKCRFDTALVLSTGLGVAGLLLFLYGDTVCFQLKRGHSVGDALIAGVIAMIWVGPWVVIFGSPPAAAAGAMGYFLGDGNLGNENDGKEPTSPCSTTPTSPALDPRNLGVGKQSGSSTSEGGEPNSCESEQR